MSNSLGETFLKNLNPNLDKLGRDLLYHLGLHSDMDGLAETFGDVGYVAMMGSGPRAFRFAQKLAEVTEGSFASLSQEPAKDFDRAAFINERLQDVEEGRTYLYEAMEEVQDAVARDLQLPEMIGKAERYWMFKVDTPAGGVFVANHHMGQPTHGILLHEVIKMLHYAGADRNERPFEFFRLGTSGGIGIEGGDMVITDRGLDPRGKAVYKAYPLGKKYKFKTKFDDALAGRLMACRDVVSDRTIMRGHTVSTDDFHTNQSRLDGAFCLVPSEEAKQKYLKKLHRKGARNMEMEAAGFGATTHFMGIPAACVCTALLNRFNGDQVDASSEELAAYSEGPQRLLVEYIRRQGLAA